MKITNWIYTGILGVLAIGLTVGCSNPESEDHSHGKDEEHQHGDHQHSHGGANVEMEGTKASEVSKSTVELCPVSGEEMGSMGKPVSYTHEGKELKFCCSGCIDTFNEDPAKYLAKLADTSKN